MKNLFKIVVLILMIQCNTQAQDAFQIFFEGTKTMPIVTNVDSMITIEYTTFSLDENREPDKTMVIEGNEVKLYAGNRTVTTYPEYGVTVEEIYDNEGVHKFQQKTVQDKLGRMAESSVTCSDERMAQFMNSSKTYEYEGDKLMRITDGGVDLLVLDYAEDEFPISFKMNAGFALMSMDREKTETGYKYNMSLVPAEEEEGLMGMMADAMKDMPKAYVLYEFKDGLHYFNSIEEDGTTGEIKSSDLYVRNAEKQLVEEKVTKGMESHKRYKYNAKGEVIETENLLENKVIKNEVDEKGNIIGKYENFNYTQYVFDENNMLIEERTFLNMDEKSLTGLKVNKIFYKQ